MRSGSTRYEDLIAWQRAMELVDLVYSTTGNWPSDERYGLVSQVRRAAVSVPANIAEGQGRNGRQEFIYHLGVSFASLCEVETLIRVATRQRYHDQVIEQQTLDLSREVGRLINGLINSLKKPSG